MRHVLLAVVLIGLAASSSPAQRLSGEVIPDHYTLWFAPHLKAATFDEPRFKATFDISLTVDAGDTAISNGRQISDVPGPTPGTHTLTFARTPKMSTYLVATLVGDFVCRSGSADGTAIRICSTPDK